MFKVEQLSKCLNEVWFIEGFRLFEHRLLSHRLGVPFKDSNLPYKSELSRLSKAVLGSVSTWKSTREGDGKQLCTVAADIEAVLALISDLEKNYKLRQRHTLCASVLYDLAGFIGVAASQVERDGLSKNIRDYFSRASNSWWGILSDDKKSALPHEANFSQFTSISELVNNALAETFEEFGFHVQREQFEFPSSGLSALHLLKTVSARYNLGVDNDLLAALQKSLETRWDNSILRALFDNKTLTKEILRNISAPAELWPVQKEAIDMGLFQDRVLSFGLAAPTGTGKTALTKLLLADFFERNPKRKAIFVSPSRALTSQIARNLSKALSSLNVTVAALGATLTIHDQLSHNTEEADLLVFTPEKADLLLRIAPEIIEQTSLVIVDEAHHIEQGTRGIILEFYLWRLRSKIHPNARVVQLSAVAPNIHELVEWLGSKDSSKTVKLDWRSNRLRLGLFEYHKSMGGFIVFEGKDPFQILEPLDHSSDDDELIAILAQRLSQNGIVLILSTTVKKAEKLAEVIAAMREDKITSSDPTSERLDARIERELYPTSPLRKMFKKGVVYHHAQLPPRVRIALEEAIAEKYVDIVCATTTLAEGVNFPFSTVIVESLVAKDYEISPRSLWNIAGRAGRFGVDTEGHCIIFRPSKWKNKLKYYDLEDYISIKLDDIPPVKSALATGLRELQEAVQDSEINFDSLEKIDLDEIKIDGKATLKAKRIRGLVNVMRVGYAHASVSETISLEDETANEFEHGQLLASRQMPDDVREFAARVGKQQRSVISNVLHHDNELLRIAARVGWSLESQNSLFEWLQTREDWQLWDPLESTCRHASLSIL